MVKVQRFNKSQMAKVGVGVVGDVRLGLFWLRCQQCGSKWQPTYLSGGRFHKRYWVCPRECNRQ
jgi:hypothetical protein